MMVDYTLLKIEESQVSEIYWVLFKRSEKNGNLKETGVSLIWIQLSPLHLEILSRIFGHEPRNWFHMVRNLPNEETRTFSSSSGKIHLALRSILEIPDASFPKIVMDAPEIPREMFML